MYRNEKSEPWVIIGQFHLVCDINSEKSLNHENPGTVYGGGYDCKKDANWEFEGQEDGLWNKVSRNFNYS